MNKKLIAIFLSVLLISLLTLAVLGHVSWIIFFVFAGVIYLYAKHSTAS